MLAFQFILIGKPALMKKGANEKMVIYSIFGVQIVVINGECR